MSMLIFLGALLVLYGIWCLTIRYSLKHLSCTRAFSRPAVFEGEEAELVEVVRNDNPFIIPWLRVESRISPFLRLGRQDNLHVSGDMYYCSLFTMMPYQQVRRRHHVRFLHRGFYDLGNASLSAGDMMGLSTFHRNQALTVPVLVYPHLIDEDSLPSPMSRTLGEAVRRQQLLQDPFLIRGIRSYQPGDPVRDIHWPATARTGELQVRIHDYSARTKLLVVLNMQNEELQWRDRLSDKDQEAVEYGISLAASLSIHTLRVGLSAGFATNMPQGNDTESTLLLPTEGTAREEELLSAFARLNIVRTQHFPTLLDSLACYSGMDFLILSRYDSESIQSSIAQLRRNGNQVSFHLYQEGSV